jgi:hypothetical protein
VFPLDEGISQPVNKYFHPSDLAAC